MLFDLFSIMMVNIVLSGDNAVVIAMCSRALPANLQTKAIIWGSAGAIGLRFLLTLAAVFLLELPYLEFAGGILLLWIAAKMLGDEESTGRAGPDSSFWYTVRTIVLADVVMSLDNTLAVAAVAKGNIPMLAAGLLISIPLIIFGSQLIMTVMNRYPVIIYAGAAVIAWTAGGLMASDREIGEQLLAFIPDTIIRLIAVGIVLAIAYWKHRGLVSPDSEA